MPLSFVYKQIGNEILFVVFCEPENSEYFVVTTK